MIQFLAYTFDCYVCADVSSSLSSDLGQRYLPGGTWESEDVFPTRDMTVSSAQSSPIEAPPQPPSLNNRKGTLLLHLLHGDWLAASLKCFIKKKQINNPVVLLLSLSKTNKSV